MTTNKPSIETIMASGEWLAHRYDPVQDCFHMVAVPREHRRKMPFLTDQYLGENVERRAVSRMNAILHTIPPGSIHFIFHSAFCCSTLLVSAFDLPGIAMGLKEPVLLNDIVGWRHRGAAGSQVAKVLDDSLVMLARPFERSEAIIVKPSNIANPMIPALMALRPQSRAVFLHAPLSDYLASIARKGMEGRLWVRDLLSKLLREGMIDLGIAPAEYLGLTDIQVAAIGWLAQHMQFQKLATALNGRVATLNSETFTARPSESLDRLARHFDLDQHADRISAVAASDLFNRNSKSGEMFTVADRTQAATTGRNIHAEEISKVEQWAKMIAKNRNIAMDLPNPLLGLQSSQ